jgi:hypothetical protein
MTTLPDTPIATIQKNAREEFRIALRTFHGRRSIDVRVYAASPGNLEPVPTAKGVTINPALFDEILGALMKARRIAVAEGLMDDFGEPMAKLPLFDWNPDRRRRKALAAPKPPTPKEVTGLHIPIVAFLDRHIADNWEFTHPATGEHRDIRTAAKLKAMGARAGWPDLVLVSPAAIFHGLEFKRQKSGRLSDVQEGFHARAKARGWPIETVDTIEAAIAVLSRWGCLRHPIVGGAR